MALTPGRRFGHYEVVAPLGAGGMGEVYRARDTNLGREVALKVLPEHLSKDENARKRFEREARAVAALSHPNILAIHDFGYEQEIAYAATELLDGETLRSRLARGELPWRKALEIGLAIADGLAAAHAKGIVHRDLKPENIFLTSGGHVKILDFGLARLEQTSGPLDATGSLLSQTEPGVVLGTVGYMSPEQVKGTTADARSDIFSFGCVLYEMVSGNRAFVGETVAESLAAILRDEPRDLYETGKAIPQELARVIGYCLEKNREARLQSARDLVLALKAVPTGSDLSSVRSVARVFMRRRAPSMALGALAAGVVATVLLLSRRAPALTERDFLLIVDLVNNTGEAVFDGTLKEALAVQLGQSPFLNLVSEEQVRQSLTLMGRSPQERLTSATGREICEREGFKAMLTSSIASLGTHYVISLNAVNARTGDSLAREQVEAASKEQVLKAIGGACSKLRERLGESLRLIRTYDAPIERATTSSLEALKAFTVAESIRSTKGEFEAIPFLQRAVDLDPNFAMAHATLGSIYGVIGQWEQSVEHTRRAFELRDRVSEREKFYISVRYYGFVTRDIHKLSEIAEQWVQAYPRDYVAHDYKAEGIDFLGESERAAAEYREEIRLAPHRVNGYANLSMAYLETRGPQEAKAVLEQAWALGVDHALLHLHRFKIGHLEHDAAAMQHEVEWARGKPSECYQRWYQASAAASGGRLRQARELYAEAGSLAERGGLQEVAAEILLDQSLQEGAFGNRRQALELAAQGMTKGHGPFIPIDSARTFALSGPTERSQPLVNEIGRRFPTDRIVQEIELPLLRAMIEINRGNGAKALDLLTPAMPYALGSGGGTFGGSSDAYQALTLRGRAQLLLGSGSEAAREFKTILGHPALDYFFSPFYPLAQLGLARAYALEGDKASSRRAYQDFLSLWKDADPDVPVLLEAQREYERLKKS